MNIRVFITFIYIATIIFIARNDAFAQESRRIKVFGNVRDADDQPIELVNVKVKGTVIGTATNEKGYYSLMIAKDDSVTIVFSSIGYNTAERIIPSLSQDMRLNVKMSYSSVDLGEVSVVAHHIQTNMMESVDVGKAKRAPDPTGGGIESLIVTYAGVSSNNELSSQYSVRGGSYDENIIYVNGIEVFRPLLIRSGQQEGLSFINPDMTEKVQFSAGGFEAMYGDKMSSVLDIAYKKPKELEGTASASMLGGSVYVGGATDKFTQVTGIRYKTNRSLLGTLDTEAEYNPDYTDLQTYMTYQISPKTEIDFLGNLSLNNYNFVPHSRVTSYGTATNPRIFRVSFNGRERDRFLTMFGALTLKYSLNDRVQYGVHASAFNSQEEESYDIAGAYLQNTAEAATTAENVVSTLDIARYREHARNKLHANVANAGVFGSVRLNTANTLKWGVHAQYERFRDRISEWERRDSSGFSLPQSPDAVNVIFNLYSDNVLESWRYSIYLQDVFKFRAAPGLFTVIGGLRTSYWNYNREWLVSPRLSVGFIPNAAQGLVLRFATGFYYQPPFYKELRRVQQDESGSNIVRLNNAIKSQRSTHFILGGDYSFRATGRNFKFTTELYYKMIDNVNPYTVDNVKIRYYGENCAKGYVAGIDMKFFGEMAPGTDSWLSLSLMRSRQTIRGAFDVPMPNDQLYNISLCFQEYFPGNKRAMINLKGVLAGGLPVTIPNKGWEAFVFRTPPYRRLDIGLLYQIVGGRDAIMDRPLFRSFKNIWLGVDVFNLFDIGNTNSYYWITDVYNEQHAVPNYLTGRQLNVRISVDF